LIESIWFEVVGAAAGAAGALLAARQSIWTWPLGLLMSLAYLLVFAEARLYSDLLLHALYVPVFVLGWVRWSRKTTSEELLSPTHASPRELGAWLVAGAIATVGLGAAMVQWTDADLAYVDAATTVFSLIALWLQGRKKIACWWMFLAVDVTSIGVYAVKALYPSILLRVVFVGIDLYGLRSWHLRESGASNAR